MIDLKDPSLPASKTLPLGSHITLVRPVRLWLSADGLLPAVLPAGLPGQIVSLDPLPLIAGAEPPRVVLRRNR